MHVRSLAAASLLAALGASAAGCYVVPAGPPPADYQPVAEYTPPPPPPPPAYTPAPAYTPYGNDAYNTGYQQPPTTTVVVYYEQPAPPPIEYYEPNVVWFYGPHPITPGYGYGWCPIQGPHAHEYEPYWNYVYSFYNGYYFYAGDPQPYGYSDVVYYYSDYHPNPWGGWCYIHGPHHHYYPPSRSQATYYQYGNDHVYTYHGSFDASFYTDRGHYQPDGHPVSNTTAYTQHVQFRQTHNVMPANFRPTVPVHSDAHPADSHMPGHDEHNAMDLGHPVDNHVEPNHVEPNHVEPNHGGPTWSSPNDDHGNTNQVDPGHFEPNHVEPNHVEPNRVEPNHVEPNRVEPNRVEPNQPGHEPNRVEPNQPGHEPNRVEPNQPGHEPNRVEPNQPGHEPNHVEPAHPPKNEPKNEPKFGVHPAASPTPTPKPHGH